MTFYFFIPLLLISSHCWASLNNSKRPTNWEVLLSPNATKQQDIYRDQKSSDYHSRTHYFKINKIKVESNKIKVAKKDTLKKNLKPNSLNTIIYNHVKELNPNTSVECVFLIISGVNDNISDYKKAIEILQELKDNNTKNFFTIDDTSYMDPFQLSNKFENKITDYSQQVYAQSTLNGVLLSCAAIFIKKLFWKKMPTFVVAISFMLPYVADFKYLKPYLCDSIYIAETFFALTGLILLGVNRLLNG